MKKIHVLFPLLFFTHIGFGQLGEKISIAMYAGPNVESSNTSPLSLNAGLDMRVRLNKVFRIALRYDNGLFDYGGNVSMSPGYTVGESSTASLRRLSLFPIVDLSEKRSALFFGFGVSYEYQPGELSTDYNLSGERGAVWTTDPLDRFARSFIIGVKRRKWSMGYSYHGVTNENSNASSGFWVSHDIISWKQVEVEKRNKPLRELLIEFGTKWDVPLNPSYAAINRIYFAPKVLLKGGKYSVGVIFEGEGSSTNFGHDTEVQDYISTYSLQRYRRDFRKLSMLQRMNYGGVLVERYKRGNNGLLFYGLGAGLMSKKGFDKWSGRGFDGTPINLEAIPKEETLGMQARVGIQASFLKPSVSILKGFGDFPAYFSFALGVEIGMLKMKEG